MNAVEIVWFCFEAQHELLISLVWLLRVRHHYQSNTNIY